MKYFFLIALIFLTACDFNASTKEIELKKIEAQKEQELAKIKAQTTLAKLEKEQRLKEIELEAENKKESFANQLLDQKRADEMEIKRYILLLLSLFLLLSTYFVYLYFKRRSENKLRAYQDNLKKYFHQQENMTRMKIAEKIIDTVANKNLTREQESELIKALGKTVEKEQEEAITIEPTEEIEILKEKKS